MCGNNMSVPLLADAVTVSGAERETAAVRTKPLALASSLVAALRSRSCFRRAQRSRERSLRSLSIMDVQQRGCRTSTVLSCWGKGTTLWAGLFASGACSGVGLACREGSESQVSFGCLSSQRQIPRKKILCSPCLRGCPNPDGAHGDGLCESLASSTLRGAMQRAGCSIAPWPVPPPALAVPAGSVAQRCACSTHPSRSKVPRHVISIRYCLPVGVSSR